MTSEIQECPEYISNSEFSLSFPELTNSLSFPGFPELKALCRRELMRQLAYSGSPGKRPLKGGAA